MHEHPISLHPYCCKRSKADCGCMGADGCLGGVHRDRTYTPCLRQTNLRQPTVEYKKKLLPGSNLLEWVQIR